MGKKAWKAFSSELISKIVQVLSTFSAFVKFCVLSVIKLV